MRGFMLALAWVMFSADARADRLTELLIVGAHVPEDGSLDAVLGVAETLPGMKPLGPDQIKTRLRGRGARIVDDALLAHGRSLLAEGRVLLEHADLESANDRISASVVAFEKAMAGSTDGRPLVEALLVQGTIGLAMGQREEAKSSFKRVLLVDPDRLLDPINYAPKMVALFDEVRDEMKRIPSGSIEVSVADPLATVHVDGRYVGVGSMVVGAIPAGRHHVLVSGTDGRRSYASVNIQSNRKLQFHAPLEDFFVGVAAESEVEREIQTSYLYRALGDQATDGLVLIAGETGVDEVGVQLYEPRTGNFSKAVRGVSNGDPLGALLTLLPEISGFLTPLGGLAPQAVSTDALGLDVSANPVLSEVLFYVEPAEPGAAGSTAASMPVAVSEPVPWGVWAGAGAMIVTATAVALLLRPTADDDEEQKRTETGTVVVQF